MAEKEKESQAKKMYGHSPKMERDEDGKMGVKKKAMEKDKGGEAEDQGTGESIPMMARHAMERNEAHHSREREHHMHDLGKHGDKKEMHERHEKMMKEMHARHEKEHGKKEE
jgi:hypothetical protein